MKFNSLILQIEVIEEKDKPYTQSDLDNILRNLENWAEVSGICTTKVIKNEEISAAKVKRIDKYGYFDFEE